MVILFKLNKISGLRTLCEIDLL